MSTPHLATQLPHLLQALALAPGAAGPTAWRPVLRPDGFDLHAGTGGAAPRPELHLAGGVALRTACAAARALGLDARVLLLPRAQDPGLLGRVVLRPGPAATDAELDLALAVLAPSRAVGSRVLTAPCLERLRAAAVGEGVVLTPSGRADVLLLSAGDDGPRSWLRAGQALGAVLLQAAAEGVHVQLLPAQIRGAGTAGVLLHVDLPGPPDRDAPGRRVHISA